MVNILEGVGLSATARLPDDNCCKTFVVAVHANGGGVECLRTYSSANGRATDCTIIEAARATSAAPTYFDAITITFPSTNTKCIFLDGGVGHNNPSPLALTEANGIWPGRTIKLLLSIGTGVAPPVRYKTHSRFNRLKAAIEAAKLASEIATQCNITHEDLLRKPDLTGKYFRFNADLGMIGLAEWDKLGHVNACTLQYLKTFEIDKSEMKCIELISAVNIDSRYFRFS